MTGFFGGDEVQALSAASVMMLAGAESFARTEVNNMPDDGCMVIAVWFYCTPAP